MKFQVASVKTVTALFLSLSCLLVYPGCTMVERRPLRFADGEDLPILWEKSGTYSRLTRPVQIVVRDRATLAQIPLAEVEVDFDTQMLLIAGLGPTMRSDLGIRIDRVWREGTRIRVRQIQVHPGLNGLTGKMRLVSPWTMVSIPKCDLEVEGYVGKVQAGLMGEISSR